MKKIIILFSLLLVTVGSVYAQPGPGPLVCVGDEDGNPDPNALCVWSMKFTNGAVTDNGDGTASIDVSGAAGSGDVTQVGNCTTGDCFTSGGSGTQLFSTTGILTLGGIGGTQNENLIFDFESTSNKVDVITSTGVTTIAFNGTFTSTTVTGANVTSGANPGHTHTGSSLSGVDISDDTNLTAGDALTLTDDDIDFDGGTAPGGELGGTWGTPTIDDSVTVTGWELGASTATTPAENDNDTSLATTAYVQTEISTFGVGDITSVGNCTTADCFTASGGTGSQLFATTGVFTIGATGGSNNESLGWNFEGTANTVAVNSTTGVTTLTLLSSGLTFSSTGGITATGVVDLGGAGSFELPNGSAPLVDVLGEVAIDTTDDQLIYYGASKRVIPYERSFTKVLETPVEGDDNVPMWIFEEACTVTATSCRFTAGSGTIVIEDTSGNLVDSPSCTGTWDTAISGTATFTEGEGIQFDTTSPTGTWVSIGVKYKVDAQ